ncbi:recombinase family protein [Rhizobium sp. 007]|uniref:recombinase family protein n=1 Tax=Rhizobium sp. 007 TaxID=2785056 RepID=UPI0032B1C3A4
MCRLHAEKQGWRVIEEYTDHAISGASLLRPGIQALIADSTRSRFDLILAEAMDRLSRNQEDIAGLFKRMSYSDVKIFTLSEGEVSHLRVALNGTMNALFLKDLADKTRRGQCGCVEAGKSGRGNSYGYDVVKKFDGDGEPIRGRTINEAHAEVVRRIFRDYAAGKSAKIIAFALNKEGIPAPTGRDWGFSTINDKPRDASTAARISVTGSCGRRSLITGIKGGTGHFQASPLIRQCTGLPAVAPGRCGWRGAASARPAFPASEAFAGTKPTGQGWCAAPPRSGVVLRGRIRTGPIQQAKKGFNCTHSGLLIMHPTIGTYLRRLIPVAHRIKWCPPAAAAHPALCPASLSEHHASSCLHAP